MKELALLGDEAAALGALHEGLSAAYGYPGTPSTELMEALIAESARGDGAAGLIARWCSNEKTALEAALGASFAGRRAIVTMKHVGLNVAADPLLNGSLLGIKGGLVIAVADDPGMHSSQNEQDSRFYAAFAMIPCLEPRTQQEAYDLSREAFALSERFHVPVLLRLVTRLSHARAAVRTAPPRPQNPCEKALERGSWMLLPVFARKNYAGLLERQAAFQAWSEAHHVNKVYQNDDGSASLAVLTSGLGGNYYEENEADLPPAVKPRLRLHIGAYPLPSEAIRRVCVEADTILVIEEGQPFIEERLRGILPQGKRIRGKLDGTLPRTGELDPDRVRQGLGLAPRPAVPAAGVAPAARPPQLCAGCPHADSYEAINRAAQALDPRPGRPSVAICSDIGCYSLGAAPPLEAIETIVCMGASIGMARGASDAGIPYAAAVIGDSTFLHSGITGLVDVVAAGSAVTIIILDNSIVAMTGGQETILPSSSLRGLILGTGLDPRHLVELEATKQRAAENAAALQEELSYRGPSVVILKRECLEALRKKKRGESHAA
jgi:indolepyruvate ferredoxin oxidoreductase alpha subunit